MARTFPNNSANRLKGASGSNGRADIPGTTRKITIAMWVKINSINAAGNNTFISKYNGSFGPLFRITDGGTKNKLSFFFVDASSVGHDAVGATVLSTGTWLHIGATYVGNVSQTMGVWLNGSRDGTTTSPSMSATADTANGWTIGARATPANPFDGDIAEVAIWNDDITGGSSTSEHMLALANGASPFQVRPEFLVAYWPLWGDYDNGIDLTADSNGANGPNLLTLVGTLATADHAPVGPYVPPDSDWPASFAAGPQTIIMGQASETDTANAIRPQRLHIIALATETDIANAITAAKLRILGMATETDTANSFILNKLVVMGQASEADTANTILPILADHGIVVIGLATEEDEAMAMCALGGRNAWVITLASHTNTVETLTPATTGAGSLTAGATVSAASLSAATTGAGTLTGTTVSPDDFTGYLPFYDPDCDDARDSGG